MKKYIASVEVPDSWAPSYGEASADFYFKKENGESTCLSAQIFLECHELKGEE